MASTLALVVLLVAAAAVCAETSYSKDEMETLELYARAFIQAREELAQKLESDVVRERRGSWSIRKLPDTLPNLEFRGKAAHFGKGALKALSENIINYVELGITYNNPNMNPVFTLEKSGHVTDLNALCDTVPKNEVRFVLYNWNKDIKELKEGDGPQTLAMVINIDKAAMLQRMAVSNYKSNFFQALLDTMDLKIKFHRVFSTEKDLAKIKDEAWLENEIINPPKKWTRSHMGDGMLLSNTPDDLKALQEIWRTKTLFDKWTGNL